MDVCRLLLFVSRSGFTFSVLMSPSLLIVHCVSKARSLFCFPVSLSLSFSCPRSRLANSSPDPVTLVSVWSQLLGEGCANRSKSAEL